MLCDAYICRKVAYRTDHPYHCRPKAEPAACRGLASTSNRPSRTFRHREHFPSSHRAPVPKQFRVKQANSWTVQKQVRGQDLQRPEQMGEQTGRLGLCSLWLFRDCGLQHPSKQAATLQNPSLREGIAAACRRVSTLEPRQDKCSGSSLWTQNHFRQEGRLRTSSC